MKKTRRHGETGTGRGAETKKRELTQRYEEDTETRRHGDTPGRGGKTKKIELKTRNSKLET